MREKVEIFKEFHKVFFDMLLDDTWLMEEPIPVEETEACWKWALHLGLETVSVEDFEKKFEITFKDITDYWNRYILKVQDNEETL